MIDLTIDVCQISLVINWHLMARQHRKVNMCQFEVEENRLRHSQQETMQLLYTTTM